MDAFKTVEIRRMEYGGNQPWKAFFDAHSITAAESTTFDDATIKERYSGEVGEEWKARLNAKVEGREYVPGEEKKNSSNAVSRTNTPGTLGNGSANQSGAISPGENTGSMKSRKEQNEDYFARLGGENATRSEELPPSQGGKFTGFGGGMPVSNQTSKQNEGIPGINDFQNDPVAALTKGFGWFTTTIGKSAKTVNDSYLQPAAKSQTQPKPLSSPACVQLAESDFAAQARLAAAEVSRNVQSSARGATDSFSRFVEGPSDSQNRSASASRRVEPERKDFWDDFAALGDDRNRKANTATPTSRSGAIGTAAMKKSIPSSTTGSSTNLSLGAGTSTKGKGKEDWDDNW
ncbi:Zn finger-containing GTPase- Activating Protein for ARF [Emydomyces testavorans]|uniref:Zn finger-containing GTPase- Activating Protein for ARF n=1 Tax=Emydomyces testavorans TaxID=2070801 RepID=A0AAF0DDZ9_9EURO|nr:Zn finger-containing GTPase- Activating Protein for ARF [Emydomyces testavorans]